VSAEAPERTRRLAASTALFSIATGLSRFVGLARETVAAALLGNGLQANAYVYAVSLPNTVRSLVADAALGASFVPVFNDLLHKGERERAWRVASTAMTLSAIVLTLASVAGMVFARPLLSLSEISGHQLDLAVRLAQVMFPTVLLLGLTGIVQAILNSFDEFFVPAFAPVLWNLVIIGFLVVGFTVDSFDTRVLLYATGTLVGTFVQLVVPLPWLRGRGGRLRFAFDIRDPAVRQILLLMLPVTLGLGLINVNQFFTTTFFAPLIDPERAGRAIDAAFRLYMLPQGMFSVAVATVLFPTLARLVAARDLPGLRGQIASGARQIVFLLVPSSILCAALATPIVRLLYQHGAWTASRTPATAACLAAFSVGLAANGVILLLNRSFFALQRPWLPTLVALGNLGLNTVLNLLLYHLGAWGLALAISLANLVAVVALWTLLAKAIGHLDVAGTLRQLATVLAACVPLVVVAYGLWRALDAALGRTTPAQLVSVGVATLGGAVAFWAGARALRIAEADLVAGLVRGRLRRARG
jgi:putative peptidoglycan lipid II flippase